MAGFYLVEMVVALGCASALGLMMFADTTPES